MEQKDIIRIQVSPNAVYIFSWIHLRAVYHSLKKKNGTEPVQTHAKNTQGASLAKKMQYTKQ